jgi:hypothetical protein
MEGLCECVDEPPGSIQCWEVLESLQNWRLLKKGSAPWVSEWVLAWILRASYTTLSVFFALLSKLNFPLVFKIIFVFFLSSRGHRAFLMSWTCFRMKLLRTRLVGRPLHDQITRPLYLLFYEYILCACLTPYPVTDLDYFPSKDGPNVSLNNNFVVQWSFSLLPSIP